MKIIIGDKAVELTDEQLDLFGKLKTKLQRNTALKSLEGLSDCEAYRQGGGKAKNPSSVTTSASEIMNNPDVRAFIESFNAHLVASTIMTREEMLERLTSMARTTITDVIKFNGCAIVEKEIEGELVNDEQSTWTLRDEDDMRNGGVSAISELTASKEGLKIKLHDAKGAMKQLAELEGFNAAARIALGGDPDGVPIQNATLTESQALELLKKNALK